jgi:hypothetical protein
MKAALHHFFGDVESLGHFVSAQTSNVSQHDREAAQLGQLVNGAAEPGANLSTG